MALLRRRGASRPPCAAGELVVRPHGVDEAGVKDTVAYRVIRQVTDHTWGSDTDLSDWDVVAICRSFASRGALWEGLLGGDMRCVEALEASIDELVGPRKIDEAAREGR